MGSRWGGGRKRWILCSPSCLSITCQVFSKDQTHPYPFSHNFNHYPFAAHLWFSIYCYCSNTLSSVLHTSLLTNAEASSPRATIWFACSNQDFQSAWDHTSPCKSTADAVSNVEKPQYFYALYNVGHLWLAQSFNQSFRIRIFVALEKPNKT